MKNDLFREGGRERVSSPDQLGRYIKIVTPSAAIMLFGLAAALIGALVWGLLGSIPATMDLPGAVVRTGGAQAPRILCVADVEGEADSLKPGMRAQVSLSAYPRDEYGYIDGVIESISAYPITVQKLAAQVGNTELAEYLLGEGIRRLVVIEPTPDENAPNGVKWSHQKGGGVALTDGQLCQALVLIREQRPIDLVLDGEKA